MAEKDTPGIVTSDSVAKAHRVSWLPLNLSPLKLIVTFAIILAIVGAGWLLWNMKKNHAASSTQTIARSHNEVVIGNAFDQAGSGDYDGAVINLKQEVSYAPDNKSKAELYAAMGTLANNAGNFADGITYGKQAEAYNPTSNSAYVIAINSESAGDKATAWAYYKKALDRLDSASRNLEPDVVDMYQQKIKELQP